LTSSSLSHHTYSYDLELRTALRAGGRRSRLRGVVFAMGQSVPFMCYSLSFWYGATLVADGHMPYFHVIVWVHTSVLGHVPYFHVIVWVDTSVLELKCIGKRYRKERHADFAYII
jgi:hypothetical protein